ncbi:MAG: hypothetical protein ACEY3J_04500 [Arsenophonus sp.]
MVDLTHNPISTLTSAFSSTKCLHTTKLPVTPLMLQYYTHLNVHLNTLIYLNEDRNDY